MIERVTKNEDRLDNIVSCIRNLEKSLEDFNLKRKDINLLNKYYGSKNWFKDKEAYEKGKNSNLKAGVLSEDAVWNMNEDINELLISMQNIIDSYKEK